MLLFWGNSEAMKIWRIGGESENVRLARISFRTSLLFLFLFLFPVFENLLVQVIFWLSWLI